MNKYYGIKSSLYILISPIIILVISKFIFHSDFFINNWILLVIIVLIYYGLFGNFLIIKTKKIIICRLFGVFHKVNVLNINLIKTLKINYTHGIRGRSIEISFYGNDDLLLTSFLSIIGDKEINRITKKFEELKINIIIDKLD